VTLPVEIYTERRVREFDESEEQLAQALRRQPPARGSARRKRRA
jgi:hypothetical protein